VVEENPTSTWQFDAEICVLKGEGTTIRRDYVTCVHNLKVRQSPCVLNIEVVNHNLGGLPPSYAAHRDEGVDDSIILRPGSRAKVTFEFTKRPEFIRPGMQMLFRDGCVRGVGVVKRIYAEQAMK
jgi:elongation factor 1-alpha